MLKFLRQLKKSLSPVASAGGGGGWFPLIRESSSGAWQRSEPVEVDTTLTHSAVFACVSAIAQDIAKLPIHVAERKAGVWAATSSQYDNLLRKPNPYQNRGQFVQSWLTSKLLHGNTYALKRRDTAGRTIALHILDAPSVEPLVSDDGAVFYRLKASKLAGIAADVVVPAREIIHDRGLTPWHPLVGVSPLTAAGLAASQGLAIQATATTFFKNGARPGVVMTAPGRIEPETAKRLKEHWDQNYTGDNAGKVAVLGDGLKPEFLSLNPVDSQLIEQMGYTAQDVCRAFRVPAWKIGAGPAAPYTSSEATNLQYLSDCLQAHIEALELCLDDGLDLPVTQRTEFDETALLRTDTKTRTEVLTSAIQGKLMTINEARAREGLPPVDGGDVILQQMQDVPMGQADEVTQ